MTALEFGVVETERRKPYHGHVPLRAALRRRLAGAGAPLRLRAEPPLRARARRRRDSVIGLLVVGAVKTWATRGKPVRSALENLAMATLGGGLAYGVGLLFDRLVNG